MKFRWVVIALLGLEILGLRLELTAQDQPLTVRTTREIPAFDVNQPAQQVGCFQAGTTLQVDITKTNAEKWAVIFTDPQGKEIRAVCPKRDLQELLPAAPSPAPASTPTAGANPPPMPATGNPSSAAAPASSGEVASILQKVTMTTLTTNDFAQITSNLLASPGSPVWSGHSSALNEWLGKTYSPANVMHPSWRRMAGLQRWCQFFGGNDAPATLAEPSTLAWLLNDPALTEDFFGILSPKDKPREVLGILQDLHKAEPSRFPLYNRLAIAMAVVWDSPPPVALHGQVQANQIPQDQATVTDRFRFWLELQEKKLANYDLARLEVEQLKFLVDAALALQELRWCQQSARYGHGNLGNAFSSINYDELRLKKEEYSWPRAASYALKEIRQRGGICVDQAYFGTIVGKAMGIPTLLFSGQGRRGPHAWFGYMKSPDRWVMDCGRYAYDKYSVGSAQDPQTDETISDHELAFLAEPFRNSPEYRASMYHLDQARRFQAARDSARALQVVETSISVCRRNLDAWQLKSDLLDADPLAEKAYGNHLNAIMTEFARYPDIKMACQEKIATLARRTGDEKSAALTEHRMVLETRNKRPDLTSEVYEKQLAECCEKGDWKRGHDVLRSAFSKLRDETGLLFHLTRTLVENLLKNDQAEEANRVMTEFRNRISMDETIARDFNELQATVKQTVKEHRKK